MTPRPPAPHALHARGFLLLELAIALILVGGLVTLLLPLWSAQGALESARQDVSTMETARQALLRQAVLANGLPAPIQFKEDDHGTGTASSHAELDATLTTLAPGWPGALPGSLLGVPVLSSLQTAYWYDVNPALLSDSTTGYYPLSVEQPDSGDWTFESILSQFDPDINDNIGTGGHARQLCRNLNTLQAIEQNIRLYPDNVDNLYERNHINLTLPRIWSTGYESHFTWDSALGYAGFEDSDAIAKDAAFDNSSAAAFVVVRRQPPALRRLDRQNTVYQQVGLTGLDPAVVDRNTAAYPSFAAERGFRIYEHPLTPATDNPSSDANDYAGRVQGVTLGEFAYSLQQAGVCNAAADRCKANQLFVRFANHVTSAPPSGTSVGLTMRWQLIDPFSTPADLVLQSGDVSSGSVSDGVCLDAYSTDTATSADARRLRVSFISPAGAVGYTSGDYWYRGGWLVDPTGTNPLPAANNGVTRWRNLGALSAAEAGNPVTIACTGSHSVTAADATGQLASTPLVPTCTVTQTP